jgi:hypothetical protein
MEVPTMPRSEPDDDVSQMAIWLTSKSHLPKVPQFVEMPSSRQGSLQPDDDAWQTASWLRAISHAVWTNLSSDEYQVTGTQRPPAADWALSLHEHLRASNLFAFPQQPEPETEQTPDEKRYHELNQKYYNGTITKEEKLELVQIQQALDEADAKDPQLMRLNKDVTAGYDKLHTALREVNRILDGLLTK